MNNSKIPFRLFRINTEEFATFPEVSIEEEQLDLKIGVSFATDKDKFAFKCVLRLLFESKKRVFMLLENSCEYETEPDSWNNLLNAKQNKITLPKEFARHLALLTLGTTRGILHSKTENTVFNNYILPVTDISKLVQKNVVINLVL